MVDSNGQVVRKIRLNSFWPLCWSEIGRRAIRARQFPPFIDASCRREPDLQHAFPSITALCRQGTFAPHLYLNDIIVYITKKGRWLMQEKHHRLVAILQVIERKASHAEAAVWYREQRLPLPSNCMMPGNPPYQFLETGGIYTTQKENKTFLAYPTTMQEFVGEHEVNLWDAEYLAKSQTWPVFIITRPLFVSLHNPPVLTAAGFMDVFGKIPNTRTPNIITKEQLDKLICLTGIQLTGR